LNKQKARENPGLFACEELTAIIFLTTIEVGKIIGLTLRCRMSVARLFVEDEEVDSRLEGFDLNRSELLAVVKEVVGARASSVSIDPLSAGGQFAYIFGTRHLRVLLMAKGWRVDRRENIEATRHPDRVLKIVYQNVDEACDPRHDPRAISGKGEGSRRLVGQGDLFTGAEAPVSVNGYASTKPAGVWFLCVSVNGEDVRAELSKASAFSGGNFEKFDERIFIVRKDEWEKIKVSSDEDSGDAIEHEPVVRRK
jgi:hypothetical protein